MSPVETKAWIFGVFLAVAIIGYGITTLNIPILVVAVLALLFLYHNHKQHQRENNSDFEPIV